jgi:ribosomal protein L14E/L6E/L27E
MALKGRALEYRGRPLRRKDNIIYYGSMADKYIVMLQILDTKVIKPVAGASPKAPEMKIATKVSVQLQLTDPDVKSRDRVVKKSEKESLYAAMDVASVWLERALASR